MATVPFPPLLGAHHLDHVPNECYLWHGTKPDVAPLIVHEGFDERVCALQGLVVFPLSGGPSLAGQPDLYFLL